MKKLATIFVLAMLIMALLPMAIASAAPKPCPGAKWQLIGITDLRYNDSRDRNDNDQVCIRSVNGKGNTGTGFNMKDDKLPRL